MIQDVKAREVLDSRGNPTVEVEVISEQGSASAIVPSGASTGVHEALELRDTESSRYQEKGVQSAVQNVSDEIAGQIKGMDPVRQQEVDQRLIELDGTENKSRLGANAILGVSMAVCRAGALQRGMALHEHIAELAGTTNPIMPIPSFNVLNGGRHAGNKLAMQEFMLFASGSSDFREALRAGAEIYHVLKSVIKERYGLDATGVGDEGGFAPNIQSNREALDLLVEAIDRAGYTGTVKIAIDAAASELKTQEGYDPFFKDTDNPERTVYTGEQLLSVYRDFIENYPVVSIEDPFDQDDWANHAAITAAHEGVQIVGDDLLVTNPQRIREARAQAACNALLLKVNQIGSVSEAIEACHAAQEASWHVMVSHRSGETEDTFIADLAVGLGTGQIKSGAPCRSERCAKYNQLLRIEERGSIPFNRRL